MTKLALVTGASRGLGRNTALAIAKRGGDVVVTYRSKADEAHVVVTEIEAMGRKAAALQLDAGDVSSFPAFVDSFQAVLKDTFGRSDFDHLINNAGHAEYASLEETTEAQFDGLVNVHFKGVLFLTVALLPTLADGARIVNVSSGLTRIMFPGFGAASSPRAGTRARGGTPRSSSS